MALVIGIPSTVVGWFIVPVLLNSQSDSAIALARVYMLHVPLGIVGDQAANLLLGLCQFRRYNAVRIIQTLAYVIGILALFSARYVTVGTVILVQFLAGCVGIAYALGGLHKVGLLSFTPDMAALRKCLTYGIRVHLGSIGSLVTGHGDKMLLAAFLGPKDLGLYSAAVTASLLPYPLISSISSILLPVLSGAEEKKGQTMSSRVIRYSWVVIVITYAGFFTVANPVILSLYGEAFTEAVGVSRILILGMIPFGLADVTRSALRALGKPLLSSLGDVTGLLMTVALLLLLLPEYRIYGAAYASLGAYCGMCIMLVTAYVRVAGVQLRRLFLVSRAELVQVWRLSLDFFRRRRSPNNRVEIT